MTTLGYALALALPAAALPSAALAAAPAPATKAEAPITQVTVYSDRARVTRTAKLHLSGRQQQQIELPMLLGSVDAQSIRVEAGPAPVDVQRVDIVRVSESRVPKDEARRLLDRLERLDDELQKVQGERGVYLQHVELLRRISPTAPAGDPLRPVPRLNPTGWGAVLEFLRQGAGRAQERARALEEQGYALGRQRDELSEQARALGASARRAGFRVVPTLTGSGPAEVRLTYLVSGARWLPTYDIQLAPARSQVEVLFSGQVSQESGEDWEGAQLTLSTAVPGTATQLPRVLTWKIGERERFIPTPVAASEAPPPPPPPGPALRPKDDEGAQLLQRLWQRAAGAEAAKKDKLKTEADWERPPAAPEQLVLEKKSVQPRPPHGDADKDAAVVEDEKRAPPAPPQAEEAVLSRPIVASGRSFQSVLSVAGGIAAGPSRPQGPAEPVGLQPPAGYRAPQLAANLPASLAGGHDLQFPGLSPETVRSGKGARRVALLSRSFAVSVRRKLLPALAPEAFLVAEIRNDKDRALPGGQASLFVGADPAGTATLQMVAPGETFTLPLGLDPALKPLRNVRVSTTQKGVFSKDEVGEYVVTTELANPYPVPISLQIIDQLPMTDDKDVEIKLLRAEPPAQPDKYTGALEWRLTVAAGGKALVSFVYTLRRPKGYRLHQ